MTFVAAGPKTKPVLDESGFQQLLAAAYVMQQHNDAFRARDPQTNTKAVLAEVAEIQALVRSGGLDIRAAARLVADRLWAITAAKGVSVSLISGGYLDCVAESGPPAAVPGGSIASHSLVATEKLRAGEIFESRDSLADIRLDARLGRAAGIGSLVTVPILRFGEIAGLIEARWAVAAAFRESDVRASCLMAELVTGMLERKARSEQRAATGGGFAFREAVSPAQIEAPPVAGAPVLKAAATPVVPVAKQPEDHLPSHSRQAAPEQSTPEMANLCRVCGRPFLPNESFCGHCSMPRGSSGPGNDLQSKWASLWYMKRAQEKLTLEPHPVVEEPFVLRPEISSSSPVLDSAARVLENEAAGVQRVSSRDVEPPAEERDIPIMPAGVEEEAAPLETARSQAGEERPVLEEPPSPVTAEQVQPSGLQAILTRSEETDRALLTGGTAEAAAQTSAAEPPRYQETAPALLWDEPLESWGSRIRAALQSAAPALGHVRARLRLMDVLLVIVVVILGIGIAVIANTPRYPGLSWSESLLVGFGLEKVPQLPGFVGNPDARVWVDEHTGFYYCAGSDLYGKTPGGRFASQLVAQRDQFVPASRTPCE